MLFGFAFVGIALAGPPPAGVDPATLVPRPSGSAQKTLVLSMTWCETLTLSVDRDGSGWSDRGTVTVEERPAPAPGRAEDPADEPAKAAPAVPVVTAAPT